MEIFLIKALQLILCFSLLIVLHEGGHFLFAKLFKVRVEKFCLFFDPWKSWKLFSWRGTDYHIGWLPLGGYVKISGMIDESMDTEQMKQPEQPWEFRAKPAWQRLLIMVGGVLINFITSLVIYAMLLFVWGDTYLPIKNVEKGFFFNESAQKFGFRNGDIPIATNEKTFDRFSTDMYRDLSTATSATVLRDGKKVTLSLPGNLNLLEMLQSQPRFFEPLMPALIDSVTPNSPAIKAGMRPGDKMLAFNHKLLTTWNEFTPMLADLQSSIIAYTEQGDQIMADSLRKVSVIVMHQGATEPSTLRFSLNAENLMGIHKHNILADYKTVTREYGFFESFPAGAAHGWNVLCGYVSDMKYVFTADGAQSIGSFGTIGSLFPNVWDWQTFWNLTAFISIMLAFVNILPIPALDGGHVLFLLYEVITRRKPSDKFMERAQMVGMCLLFALMAYALFNDALRFIF